MKQRVITALIIVVVLLLALALGDIGMIALVIAAMAFATYELYHLVSKKVKPVVYLTMLIPMLSAAFATMEQLISIICIYIFLLSLLTIFSDWFTLDSMGIVFLSSSLIMIAVYVAVNLYRDQGALAFLWVIVANFSTDTAAYFVGSKFGRTKLIPSVSPKKTWEGAIGGYFVGLIVGLVFGWLFASDVIPMDFIILASLLIPIVAQIGDLFFSKIKRSYGIKDFGTLLPSHGGVLDRIDSLVFTLVLLMLLRSISGGF